MNRYEILKNRLGLSGGIGSKQTTEGYAGGGGGGDDPKPKTMTPLSHEQVTMWSDFVDKNPQMKTMDELWGSFSSQNPKSGIDRDNLRMNLDALMAKIQDRGKAWGLDRPDLLTPGMSFPMVYYGDKSYGRMNAYGQTKVPVPQTNMQYPEKLVQKTIPNDVTNIWYDDTKGLYAYDDPREGVIKFASKEAANTPRVREIIKAQYEKEKSQ